jgi:hypothetical protein
MAFNPLVVGSSRDRQVTRGLVLLENGADVTDQTVPAHIKPYASR